MKKKNSILEIAWYVRFRWWREDQYLRFLKKFNLPQIQLARLDPAHCKTWITWRFFAHYDFSCHDCRKGIWRKGYCDSCMDKREVPSHFVCKECLDRCGSGEESLAVYPRKYLAYIHTHPHGKGQLEGQLYDEYECSECAINAHDEHIAGKYQFG